MGKGHSWSRFTAENLILGLASLAFLITVSGSILYSLELSKKFDHLDEDDIVFVIPVGASFNLIKEILLESGVLKSSLFFSKPTELATSKIPNIPTVVFIENLQKVNDGFNEEEA